MLREAQLRLASEIFNEMLRSFFQMEGQAEMEFGDSLEEFIFAIFEIEKARTGIDFFGIDKSENLSDQVQVPSVAQNYEIWTVKEESNEEDGEEEKSSRKNFNFSTPEQKKRKFNPKRKRFRSLDRDTMLRKYEEMTKAIFSKSFKEQRNDKNIYQSTKEKTGEEQQNQPELSPSLRKSDRWRILFSEEIKNIHTSSKKSRDECGVLLSKSDDVDKGNSSGEAGAVVIKSGPRAFDDKNFTDLVSFEDKLKEVGLIEREMSDEAQINQKSGETSKESSINLSREENTKNFSFKNSRDFKEVKVYEKETKVGDFLNFPKRRKTHEEIKSKSSIEKSDKEEIMMRENLLNFDRHKQDLSKKGKRESREEFETSNKIDISSEKYDPDFRSFEAQVSISPDSRTQISGPKTSRSPKNKIVKRKKKITARTSMDWSRGTKLIAIGNIIKRLSNKGKNLKKKNLAKKKVSLGLYTNSKPEQILNYRKSVVIRERDAKSSHDDLSPDLLLPSPRFYKKSGRGKRLGKRTRTRPNNPALSLSSQNNSRNQPPRLRYKLESGYKDSYSLYGKLSNKQKILYNRRGPTSREKYGIRKSGVQSNRNSVRSGKKVEDRVIWKYMDNSEERIKNYKKKIHKKRKKKFSKGSKVKPSIKKYKEGAYIVLKNDVGTPGTERLPFDIFETPHRTRNLKRGSLLTPEGAAGFLPDRESLRKLSERKRNEFYIENNIPVPEFGNSIEFEENLRHSARPNLFGGSSRQNQAYFEPIRKKRAIKSKSPDRNIKKKKYDLSLSQRGRTSFSSFATKRYLKHGFRTREDLKKLNLSDSLTEKLFDLASSLSKRKPVHPTRYKKSYLF